MVFLLEINIPKMQLLYSKSLQIFKCVVELAAVKLNANSNLVASIKIQLRQVVGSRTSLKANV